MIHEYVLSVLLLKLVINSVMQKIFVLLDWVGTRAGVSDNKLKVNHSTSNTNICVRFKIVIKILFMVE